MCRIALPTLLLDTLCGRFSMTGKVEAIRGTPPKWNDIFFLLIYPSKLDGFELVSFESIGRSEYKKQYIWWLFPEILWKIRIFDFGGELSPFFKLQYVHSSLSSWQCYCFFTPWTDVPTLWTTWEALSLWTTRARPPPTPKSGGLMSRPLPSWTLTQAVQV